MDFAFETATLAKRQEDTIAWFGYICWEMTMAKESQTDEAELELIMDAGKRPWEVGAVRARPLPNLPEEPELDGIIKQILKQP